VPREGGGLAGLAKPLVLGPVAVPCGATPGATEAPGAVPDVALALGLAAATAVVSPPGEVALGEASVASELRGKAGAVLAGMLLVCPKLGN
jgi:hypothetical protein